MIILSAALGIMLAGGAAAFLIRKFSVLSSVVGAGTAVLGCVIGLIAPIAVLTGHAFPAIRIIWSLPDGLIYLRLDALAAWFLLPIFGLSLASAVYGKSYLSPWQTRKSVGASWFFFNLLISSMAMVVLARNGFFFLFSWELMSVSSYFLVTFEDEKRSVRDAGLTYLILTHMATACLFVLFLIMARQSGSLDFDQWSVAGNLPQGLTALLFLLAVVGFGTKAGLVPFHIWLPDAHPAAPSHVSAVMSGVMIKTGIYGLLRFISFSHGAPPAYWGWSFVGLGALSGVVGIIFAMAQRDLKRLLAYSSVENIGIIVLGLGVGLLGMSFNSPTLILLGFAGSLLHVVNHAFFKGLLFMGAGAVLHGSKTLEIDQLGGLYKRMPWTGLTFLIGAAAIAGLPPLNGFVGEFFLYLSAVKGIVSLHGNLTILPIIIVTTLVVIGGFAAASFTKAFGIIFLGEPRSDRASHAHEAGLLMLVPMIILAAGCVGLGLAGPFVVTCLRPALASISYVSPPIMPVVLADASSALRMITVTGAGLSALVALLAFLRLRLLSRRRIDQAGTWDCGYVQPTARMQYTSTSFINPLTTLFRLVLQSKKKSVPVSGLFPRHAAVGTATPDVFSNAFYRPLYHGMRHGLSKLRWLQHGRVQAYILYIGVTLLILLIWSLR